MNLLTNVNFWACFLCPKQFSKGFVYQKFSQWNLISKQVTKIAPWEAAQICTEKWFETVWLVLIALVLYITW